MHENTWTTDNKEEMTKIKEIMLINAGDTQSSQNNLSVNQQFFTWNQLDTQRSGYIKGCVQTRY